MRFVVAIALLFSITPGMSEVIETAAHLIGHADLPHHESEAERGCSEHTCTPLAHQCGCHKPMSAQAATGIRNADCIDRVSTLPPCALTAAAGRVSEPPPLRPPIA
ncbi:MAG: hypothetical protein SFX73_17730 [Kofleriaceae bacterium]|nr:hypothetical protein [Kofleriaceae bacterium]